MTLLEVAAAVLFAALVGLLAAVATRSADASVAVLFTLAAIGGLLVAALAIFVMPHRH